MLTSCTDIELLLCDYVDGTLTSTQKSAVEAHLASCEACREFAHDASGAVEFISRSAAVEPPPELMTRLLFQLPDVKQELKPNWMRRTFGDWISGIVTPVLQPRVAMSMAMTVLSFAMLAKCGGVQPRQLKASDLNPVSVVMSVEDRFSHSWSRAVKYYDSLRFVYEIQGQIQEWREQSSAGQEKPVSATEQQEQKPKQSSAKESSGSQASGNQSTPSETSPK